MIAFLKRHARAAVLALAGLAVVTAAYALNVPSTANFPARQNLTQQTNYLRFTVNYNDARISSGVKFARLPANAYVVNVECHVTTAFNAGTTNVFTVGNTTAADEIITGETSNRSIDESSATVQKVTASASLGLNPTSSGEVDLYAKYAQTGTAASAGSATCVVEYIPNNDQ